MNLETYDPNIQNSNRRLLNIYWGMIAIQIPVQLFYFLTYRVDLIFLNERVIIPSLVMMLVMIVLEAVYRWKAKLLDYWIILGGTLISFSFIYSHYDVKAVLMILFLPILVSVFYFNPYKILFSVTLTLLAFCSLYVLRLAPLAGYELRDWMSILPILGFASFIALGIMNRGIELLKNLKMTSELKQELMIKNIIMDKLSKTDALTDLYNHITFHEYLEKLIEQSESGYLSIHLAILDIDNFKRINDTYGHRAGDSVLRKVSAILKERVGPNDFPARYGGEEFAIIFTEKALDEVFEIVETIRWHISQTVYEELHGQSVTISIGLSEYRRGSGKEHLFSGADQSLYAAKKTGKNKTVIYSKVAEAN